MFLITKILVASSNPHKLEEISAIWDQQRRDDRDAPPIELLPLSALGMTIAEPPEDQPTFEANAILKADYYASRTGMLCLADDSGLEVDALAGQPGVRSARYAGLGGFAPTRGGRRGQ